MQPTQPPKRNGWTRRGGHPADTDLLGRLAARRPAETRYTQGEEIARGGMGAILNVWDEDLRRELAMKVCRDFDGDEGVGERLRELFLEEAQITGQLAHPGVVPVHELGLDDRGRVFFTMPLVRGRTLNDIIDLVRRGEEGWTLSRALAVMLKVCETMAYAHSKGVIHRDLKPANVMVGRFGETYVMDWGIARLVGEHGSNGNAREAARTLVLTDRSIEKEKTPGLPTISGGVVGTPAYMSPEQARGKLDQLGPRADVYSVGAMLYHLLSGRMPYEDRTETLTACTVLGFVMTRPPEPLHEIAPDAPEDLIAVCEKAMARDRRDRYADTMEMAKDIERFLDRRPVHAQPVRPWYALRLWVARNRTVTMTVAASFVVLLVALVVFIAGLHSAAERERSAAEKERIAHAESVRRGDEMAAQALILRENELYPAVPDKVKAMEVWLAQVADLLSRKVDYDAQRASTLDRRSVDDMLERMERLALLAPEVAERMAFAGSLEERTIQDQEERWASAVADVASLPAYGGLELKPQLGLVPLWRNPSSGLWEFWHVASGERPDVADADNGLLEIRPETGLVFVLLAGGEFPMGANRTESGFLRVERRHTSSVEPFFISRYEVTQAQYERITGTNPSMYQRAHKPEVVATHPVERVSWFDCAEATRRIDLRLPTEREWEYAARGGTDTAYHTGDAGSSLEHYENVFDQSGRFSGVQPSSWTDGYDIHAPVGSFRPNAFGLHDTLGNLSEWCADWFELYPETDEGLMADKHGSKVFRGGSWYLQPLFARAAFRQWDAPGGQNQARGFRPARSLR